jgi:ABC-type uncharacterized transport system involved in gliding motility auxiliary subunit
LKYCGWFGVGLIVAGITAGVVAGDWGVVPTGMIVAGAVLVGIWLLFLGRLDSSDQPSFWQRRSTRISTNVLVSSLSVVIMVGLLNFLAVRYGPRFDLTETQLFSLAPATQDVLRSVRQPVSLYIFDPQPHPSDRALLENLRRQNPNFQFEYIDPALHPDLARRFNLKNDQFNRDVYLENPAQNRSQLVQVINAGQRLSESKIANALIRMTRDRQTKVYALQGHGELSLQVGEDGMAQAVKALQDQNIQVEPLNLAQTGQIPADAAAVMIAGPQNSLFETEVKLLQDYQKQGGSLLVLVDPQTQPGLEGLLQEWGISLDQRLAIDASGTGQVFGLGPAAPIVQTYSDHPITRNFRNAISFYPFARPLEIKPVPGVEANPIVLTSEKSWGEANSAEKPVKFEPGDRPGPLPIGVALSQSVTPATPVAPTPSATASPEQPPNQTSTASPSVSPAPIPSATASTAPTTAAPTIAASPTPSPGHAAASPSPPGPLASPPTPSPSPTSPPQQARLVVFGNSRFASDRYFAQQINGDVFLNAVAWVSRSDAETLSIRPAEVNNRRLTLTNQMAVLLSVLALVLVPLASLITAGVLWWRSR